MVNIPDEILFSELSIIEQREALQKENPDKLAWVFDLIWSEWYELVNLENVLCCYPNQLEDWQIVLPEDFSEWNIVILNMWALRKWQVEIIAWDESNIPEWINSPVLLSPWVIEYYESEKWEKYVQTVLRDGGQMNASKWISSLADANERTTTAGRNFSGDLFEDLEVENAEESPFLMQNDSWEYYLVTHDLKYKYHLIASIENFLEKKYLKKPKRVREPYKQNYHNTKFYNKKLEEYNEYLSNLENYEEVKTRFEAKFTGVDYDDLWNILIGIIKNDNIEEYTWEAWNIDEIQMEQVKLGAKKGEFLVFHDEPNNTVEYRSIRKILWFPDGLKPLGRIPLRLFLESQNQDPSFKNIKNISKYGAWKTKLVPTMNDFADRVWEIV